MRVLVADGDPAALDELAGALSASPAVRGVRTARDGEQALAVLAQERVDAVFLAVRMPGIDGLAVARLLRLFAHPPAIVFVSADGAAAVEAFELRAVDYLVRPVERARLDEALARIAGRARAPEAVATAEDPDVVPVDTLRGRGTRLLPRARILFLQAHGDYVRIVSQDGRFLLRGRLTEIERRWAPFGFVRVHRQYVANLRRATEVRPRRNGTALLRFDDGSEVPIARRQVAGLRRRLRA